MRRILLALALVLAPAAAWSETCTLSGTGNLTYTAPTTLAYSGTTTGCTLSLDDALTITGAVTVTYNVGQSANPLTGGITVQSGGTFTVNPGATIFETGDISYASGSAGTINGKTMTTAAPQTITFPSATTITFDFAGCAKTNRSATTKCTWPSDAAIGTLWTLCSSASSCGAQTIHAATTNEAATLVYIDFEKMSPAEYRFIGESGRAADTNPVYNPGLYLTVTSVDTTNNTVTVTLPDVGTVGASTWFTVARAFSSGSQLQNIVGGTSWTVQNAPAVAYNNEGKRRYEIQISTADTPIDNDHDFEGWLICRHAGGYCARIIKTEKNAHDTTGTTVVVWNDPTGIVAASDEMDVYYAKPTPADTLVFVNPVKLDFTGGGRLMVANGAAVGTTAAPSSGVWITGARGGKNDEQAGGVTFDTETAGVNLDLWLVENGDGTPTGGTHPSPDALSVRNLTNGAGTSDIYVRRTTIRWPQVAQTVWNDGSSFYSTPNAIVLNETNGGDANVRPWLNNALRKIRIEGYNYGLNGGRGGLLRSCRDGLWVQDLLVTNSRSAISKVAASQGNDTLEFQALGANCGVDRVAAVIGTWSSIVFRSAREAVNEFTSIVAFGANGRISATYPATADNTTYPSQAAYWFQGQDGSSQAAYYARGYTRLVNWVTDGKISNDVDNAYGAFVDWFVAASGPPSVDACENTTGFYQIGGAPGQKNLGQSATASTGSCTSTTDVLLRDVYMGGLGGTTLNAEVNYDHSIGTYMINVSGKTVAPASLTLDSWVYANKRQNNSTVFTSYAAGTGWQLPLLWFKNYSLISATQNGGRLFRTAYPSSVPNVTAFKATNTFWGQPDPTPIQVIIGGTDVTISQCQSGGGPSNTQICSSASGENEIYFGTNKYLGVAGDMTTGLGLRPLSWSSSETGTADPASAAPRYAGPIVYDWPFAWATMNPVPGYRRTTPRLDAIPARLKARMAGGGSGSGGWLPRAF